MLKLFVTLMLTMNATASAHTPTWPRGATPEKSFCQRYQYVRVDGSVKPGRLFCGFRPKYGEPYPSNQVL